MYLANATVGIHGYFYYANFSGNNNKCQIKGLQEIRKLAIFISEFNQKWVSYRHIVPSKQNKLFALFITFTIRYMSCSVSSVHQCHGANKKNDRTQSISLIQNWIFAAILNLGTFPSWDSWGLLICFSGLYSE